jgi:hypothetical protein
MTASQPPLSTLRYGTKHELLPSTESNDLVQLEQTVANRAPAVDRRSPQEVVSFLSDLSRTTVRGSKMTTRPGELPIVMPVTLSRKHLTSEQQFRFRAFSPKIDGQLYFLYLNVDYQRTTAPVRCWALSRSDPAIASTTTTTESIEPRHVELADLQARMSFCGSKKPDLDKWRGEFLLVAEMVELPAIAAASTTTDDDRKEQQPTASNRVVPDRIFFVFDTYLAWSLPVTEKPFHKRWALAQHVVQSLNEDFSLHMGILPGQPAGKSLRTQVLWKPFYQSGTLQDFMEVRLRACEGGHVWLTDDPATSHKHGSFAQSYLRQVDCDGMVFQRDHTSAFDSDLEYPAIIKWRWLSPVDTAIFRGDHPNLDKPAMEWPLYLPTGKIRYLADASYKTVTPVPNQDMHNWKEPPWGCLFHPAGRCADLTVAQTIHQAEPGSLLIVECVPKDGGYVITRVRARKDKSRPNSMVTVASTLADYSDPVRQEELWAAVRPPPSLSTSSIVK